MSPETTTILQHSFGSLMLEIAPHLGEDYTAGSTAVIGFLMLFAAQEHERGADIRFRENVAMRGLFSEAAPMLPEGDLRDAVAAAAASRDENLSISVLNEGNAALKEVLIELHAFVEEWADPQARSLDDRIWALHRHFVEGRALQLPQF